MTSGLRVDCRAVAQFGAIAAMQWRAELEHSRLSLFDLLLYLHKLHFQRLTSLELTFQPAVVHELKSRPQSARQVTPSQHCTQTITMSSTVSSAINAAKKAAVNTFGVDAFTTSGASGLVGALPVRQRDDANLAR